MKTTLFFLLLCANMAFAQSEIAAFPFDTVGFPKAFIQRPEGGDCYAFMYYPDIYVTPDGKQYEVFTKKKKYSNSVATCIKKDTIIEKTPLKWIQKSNLKLPKGVKLLDPVYKEITTYKEIIPASVRWVFKKGDANCLSINLEFAQVVCLVEVPAQYYKQITAYEMTKPPRKIIKKDTITLTNSEHFEYYWEASETKIHTRCSEYTHKKGVVKYVDTFYCAQTLPKDAVLVQKGSISDWKKVICGGCSSYAGNQRVAAVQKSLKAKGYYKGKIDNVMNKKTKKAALRFQKDKNLPIGTLDLQTLKALGIEL